MISDHGKHVRRLASVCCLLLILGARNSLADNEPKMPPGKSRPTTVLRDPAVTDQGWMVFLAADGYAPRQSWEDAAEPLGKVPPTTFMMPAFAIYEYQAPGEKTNNWLLVGAKKKGDRTDLTIETIYGWVPRDIVLETTQCRKNPISGIDRKILMVNDPGVGVKSDAQAGVLVGQPRQGSSKIFEVKLYEPLFIFKYVPNEGQPQHVLVGTTPAFNESTAKERVKGWIDLNKVPHAFWNTRQGIEWNFAQTWPDAQPDAKRRTAAAEIFSQPEGAYKAYYPELASKFPQIGTAEARVLFKESFVEVGSPKNNTASLSIPPGMKERFAKLQETAPQQLISRPYKPQHSRPPLLETARERSKTAGIPWAVRQPKINELLHVGGIGGRGKLTASEIDEIRNECSRRVGDVKELELLFVVDRTGSMNEFFPAVAQTIKQITEHAEKNAREVKVGVVMYDDRETDALFPDRAKRVTPTKLVYPLMSAAEKDAETGERRAAAMARKILGEKAVGGGDPGEEMIQGIFDAVNTKGVSFSQWSHKLIIVLTDDGDRIGNNVDPANKQTLAAETKALDRLKQIVVPDNSSPLRLFFVQVREPDNRPQSRSLVRQIDYLRDASRNWWPGVSQELVSTVVATTPEKVIASIDAQYASVRQAADKLASELEILASANPVSVGPEAKAIFESANPGIKLDEYLAQGEGNQLFRVGYVWKWPIGMEGEKGSEQVKTSVLLSKDEVIDICYLMRLLLNDKKTPAEGLQTMIRTLMERNPMAGETGKEVTAKTANELFRTRLGIELNSPLFDIAPANLDAKLSRQDREEVRRRFLLLEGIEKGEARILAPKTTVLAGEMVTRYEVAKAVPYERFISRYAGDETVWCWVSEDELP